MYMDFLASSRKRAKENLDSVVIYIRHFMGQGLGSVSIEFKPAVPLNLLAMLNSYSMYEEGLRTITINGYSLRIP